MLRQKKAQTATKRRIARTSDQRAPLCMPAYPDYPTTHLVLLVLELELEVYRLLLVPLLAPRGHRQLALQVLHHLHQ